jgi:hypothetical protein
LLLPLILVWSQFKMTPQQREKIMKRTQEVHEAFIKKQITDKSLSMPGKVLNLSKSMSTWAGSGFKKVQQHVYERRLAICRKCKFWEEKGNLGMGKCLKCGCGKGKHWLPHEQCPIGLWGKENT